MDEVPIAGREGFFPDFFATAGRLVVLPEDDGEEVIFPVGAFASFGAVPPRGTASFIEERAFVAALVLGFS